MTVTAANPLFEYRLALLAVATIAAIALVYWQTFERMTDMWALRSYQHAWLVVPVVLYVLWRKRDVLAAQRWRTSGMGAVLAALLVMVWLVSRSVGVQVIEFASATLLVFAVYWAIAGREAAMKARFPLLLLVAAVPTGEFLVEPLMLVTAEIASVLLNLTGIPVYRDRQFFTLPGGSFEVADVCSGLRYLLAGVMASMAFAYVTYTGNTKRALFVAIVAMVLVVTNGTRAFIVMVVASATDMRVFGGPDHVTFGMLLFAAVFILAIWIGEKYADPEPVYRHAIDEGSSGIHGMRDWAPVVAVLLVVFGGLAHDHLKTNRALSPLSDPQPPLIADCGPPGEWNDVWQPQYSGSDRVFRASWHCGDFRIGVYSADYRQQRQGKELISSSNRVWPNDWRRYTDTATTTVSAGETSVPVREALVRDPAGWRLMRYWYQVGDTVTDSSIRVKLQEAVHALSWEPVESSIVVVSIRGRRQDNAAELRERIEAPTHAVMAWKNGRGGQER